MIPVEEDETAAYTVRSLPEDFDIPTHKLFEGGESSGPTPLSACRPDVPERDIFQTSPGLAPSAPPWTAGPNP